MITAGQIINSAMKVLGLLAAGETLTANESSDALATLNQMLDSWSTANLNIYAIQEQVLTWPGGSESITIGPTGTVIGEAPLAVLPSTFFVLNSDKHQIRVIGVDQFNAIQNDAGTVPTFLYVNNTRPNVTLHAAPYPSADCSLHLVSALSLPQSVSLATVLYVPPGYLKAFKFGLACELAPEFGIEASPTVQREAMTAKRLLKRNNYYPANMMMHLPNWMTTKGSNILNGE